MFKRRLVLSLELTTACNQLHALSTQWQMRTYTSLIFFFGDRRLFTLAIFFLENFTFLSSAFENFKAIESYGIRMKIVQSLPNLSRLSIVLSTTEYGWTERSEYFEHTWLRALIFADALQLIPYHSLISASCEVHRQCHPIVCVMRKKRYDECEGVCRIARIN